MPLDQMTQPGPDGWDADSHPFPTGWPAPTRRMSAQRWLVDAVIRQVGVDWDQGRTRYIGNAGGTDAEIDFGQARERIAKLADIERVFATLGMRRERLAEAAVAAGHHVTARKHAYIASLLWGAAEWTFFVSPEQVRRAEVANQHKLRCYDLWMEHAPHPVRRIRVPYGRGSLSGILHLPPNASGPVPCVLHVGAWTASRARGAHVRGPIPRSRDRAVPGGPAGQGEAVLDGAFIGRTNMVEAGLASPAVLRQDRHRRDTARPDGCQLRLVVGDPDRRARTGPRGTAVWAVVHKRACAASSSRCRPPSRRASGHGGLRDEDAFDAFVRRWSLAEEAPRVTIRTWSGGRG